MPHTCLRNARHPRWQRRSLQCLCIVAHLGSGGKSAPSGLGHAERRAAHRSAVGVTTDGRDWQGLKLKNWVRGVAAEQADRRAVGHGPRRAAAEARLSHGWATDRCWSLLARFGRPLALKRPRRVHAARSTRIPGTTRETRHQCRHHGRRRRAQRSWPARRSRGTRTGQPPPAARA